MDEIEELRVQRKALQRKLREVEYRIESSERFARENEVRKIITLVRRNNISIYQMQTLVDNNKMTGRGLSFHDDVI